ARLTHLRAARRGRAAGGGRAPRLAGLSGFWFGAVANRLAAETSPYLLQHADKPVDWFPWGDEAFSKARAEDKPIMLSVGCAPFLGGTYYPPEPRPGLPSFRQVLTAVSDAYRERRSDVSRQASAIVDAVRQSAELPPSTDPLTESLLGEASRALARQFDREWG